MPQFYAKTRLPTTQDFHIFGGQLIKFVANVAIQVAQPQLHANPTQDKKSSLRRRVSKAAKYHLGVDITGISLFDSIDRLRLLPPNPKPLLPKVKPPSVHLIHQSHQTISHP